VKDCKNDKSIRKINEVCLVTLRSTHGVDKKYNIQFPEVQLSRELLENDKII
jgi:hypothetical protein